MGLRPAVWRVFAAAMLLLHGCGGGGGDSNGGGSGSNSGGGGGQYPSPVQSGSFAFPSITLPAAPPVAQDRIQGVVLLQGGLPAPAGLTVELVDAAVPASPRVVGSTVTNGAGQFSLARDFAVSPTSFARISLPDGAPLRAYAAPWTEISPGTEAAVVEIERLRAAGAFEAHSFTITELDAAQRGVGLLWRTSSANLPVAEAVSKTVARLQFMSAWNQHIGHFAQSAAFTDGTDLARIMPTEELTLSALSSDVSGASVALSSSCTDVGADNLLGCRVFGSSANTYTQEIRVYPERGVTLMPQMSTDALSQALAGAGELPLIEFPYAPGSRVLYANPRMKVGDSAQFNASLKVTRHTYPVAPVTALGTTVQAIEVVLDYELAVLDPTTKKQIDVLGRERRWFSPAGGIVRYEVWAALRDGATVETDSSSLVVDGVSGLLQAPTRAPLAGRIDVRSVPIQHQHAVYAPATNRVYVAVGANGGRVLELDGTTFATLRSVALEAVPRRLAVSADGGRLYVGLDGGQVVELATTDLVRLRTTALPPPPPLPSLEPAYDRIYDMSVDPFDPSRVIVMFGSSRILGDSGPVAALKNGVWSYRDAPRSPSWGGYGWSYYGLYRIAWTATPHEFLAVSYDSPSSMYRFRLDPVSGLVIELAARERDSAVSPFESDGIVLADDATLLRASDLNPLSILAPSPDKRTPVGLCRKWGPSAVCATDSGGYYGGPRFVRFDMQSGAYLGVYSPVFQESETGCTGVTVRPESLGGGASDSQAYPTIAVTPISTSTALISAMRGASGSYCALQLWRLRGVSP